MISQLDISITNLLAHIHLKEKSQEKLQDSALDLKLTYKASRQALCKIINTETKRVGRA